MTLQEHASSHDTEPASHPLLASSDSPVFFEETSIEISKVGQTTVRSADQSADWLVNVTLAVRSIVGSHAPTVTIAILELHISSGALSVGSIKASSTSASVVHASFIVPEGVPERWYPHNLGTPRLYNFTISLELAEGARVSFTARSGFRTVELVQTAYPAAELAARGITPGDQWHFAVNGKAFYTLGTNIIPFDPFYARMTTAQVRWVLESAVQSGQNMVRPVACAHRKRAVVAYCSTHSCACGAEGYTSRRTN